MFDDPGNIMYVQTVVSKYVQMYALTMRGHGNAVTHSCRVNTLCWLFPAGPDTGEAYGSHVRKHLGRPWFR